MGGVACGEDADRGRAHIGGACVLGDEKPADWAGLALPAQIEQIHREVNIEG